MPRKKIPGTSKRTPPKPKGPAPGNLPFHAFWSGSLSFGLVNVPVLLFPATRSSAVRLRLVSPEGSLLERRFFCPRDGKEVALGPIMEMESASITKTAAHWVAGRGAR